MDYYMKQYFIRKVVMYNLAKLRVGNIESKVI